MQPGDHLFVSKPVFGQYGRFYSHHGIYVKPRTLSAGMDSAGRAATPVAGLKLPETLYIPTA